MTAEKKTRARRIASKNPNRRIETEKSKRWEITAIKTNFEKIKNIKKEKRGGNHTINRGANTTATIVMSLMRMLIAGPAVSLKGSPTVSPVTPAMWAPEPFPP